ncbi:MAG: hypothetical protein IPN78_12745 [Candidatus Accumulibacter sp.]|nr:hypothetical protein [Candidatus Accumulibacter propinquus]
MNEPGLAALIARRSPDKGGRCAAGLAAWRPAALWRQCRRTVEGGSDGGRLLNAWTGLLPGLPATRTGGARTPLERHHAKLALAVLTLCPVDKARRVRWLGLRGADALLRQVFVAATRPGATPGCVTGCATGSPAARVELRSRPGA